MNKLVKIVSKNNKCLCKGCDLFERGKDTCCPIAHHKENIEFEGEFLPSWKHHGGNTTWCKFRHCDMKAGEQKEIWNSPGYRVKGQTFGNIQYMWIPESIVRPGVKGIQKKKDLQKRSKLAKLAIRDHE